MSTSSTTGSGLRPGFLIALVIGFAVVGSLAWRLRSNRDSAPAAAVTPEGGSGVDPGGSSTADAARSMFSAAGRVRASRDAAASSGASSSETGEAAAPVSWWIEGRLSPELHAAAKEASDRAINDLFRYGVFHAPPPVLQLAAGGADGVDAGGGWGAVGNAGERSVEGADIQMATNGVQAYRQSDRIRSTLVKEMMKVRREAIRQGIQAEQKAAGGGPP